MARQFPIVLRNDVEIVAITPDGYYVVKYQNVEGKDCFLWLADESITNDTCNDSHDEVVDIVKQFIKQELQEG